MNNIFAAIVLTVFFACPALAQVDFSSAPSDSSYLETREGEFLRIFLNAYNSSDRVTLERFAAEHYTADYLNEFGGATGRADYWLKKFSQLGPLKFHTTGEIMGRPVAWLVGTVSKGWIGQILVLTDDTHPRIDGHMSLVGSGPPGIRSVRGPLAPSALTSYLDEYFDQLKRHDLFSGAVLVAKDGRPIFERAIAFAELRHRTPNHLDTRFALASMGKLFTAMAVLRLAEEGELSLSDPLTRFVPEYPDHIGARVTLRNLLTHSSGIELDEVQAFNQAKSEATSLDELLQVHLAFLDSLENYENFTVPDRFNYTNEGYDLLGIVIARASQMPYETYLREYIFKPAGMHDTGVLSESSVPHLANGYYSVLGSDGTPKVGPPVELIPTQTYPQPSGGHYSTVGDLLRFVNALQEHELLREETIEQALTRQVKAGEEPGRASFYGYGFKIQEEAGLISVGHEGAYAGISTDLSHYPDQKYTVVILSNYSFVARTVARHIRELIGPP